MTSPKYDIIIAGTGCAGLSLIMHLLHSGKFSDKKILLVDQNLKNRNDRTWCFWETKRGMFQPIVYKEWKQLSFYNEGFSVNLNLGSYVYKLIRGIDFYEHCFNEIAKHSNITFLQAPVSELVSDGAETYALINKEKIYASYIFNSILFKKPTLKTGEHWLLQHFKGWIVQTDVPHFSPDTATLMDFRTPQTRGAAFFYFLPFTEKQALVEYTLFSKELLAEGEYEIALKTYVEKNLGVSSYKILDAEFGVIPMTNYRFPKQTNRIIHIGTAGGQTKASSGYTFQFIQKQSAAIVKGFLNGNNPGAFLRVDPKFQFYDSVLLQILGNNRMPGDQIFTHMFRANKAERVFKFLDNETSLLEDIPILKSLPTLTFLKAGLKEMKRQLDLF